MFRDQGRQPHQLLYRPVRTGRPILARACMPVLLGAIILTTATGCSSSSGTKAGNASARTGSGSAAPGGTITIFAAASLKESFTTLGQDFEKAYPRTTVKFNFGASSALATQLNAGAPADVFASAAVKNMTQVTDKGAAANPSAFASNSMEIAVPPGNPAGVTSLADLGRSSLKVALCQAQVPCGSTALTVFKNAELTVKPVTLEQDVKSVLTKVELNEVDAGIVYVSDVQAAGAKVTGIVIPASLNSSTTYPIAVLTKAPNPGAAAAFVRYVLSTEGQAVLSADGFAKPN
ncbi:MAG: molybdate transport system substrate-binding protein [Pseudonocardiales bacterium]|nr:molybdate transport system substrate-binding protein [Pseudonocardiales bacterium]